MMDVRDLIKLMKAEGALRVKMGQLEVELSPHALAGDEKPAAPTMPAMPTDFRFWSVDDQSPLPQLELVEPTP